MHKRGGWQWNDLSFASRPAQDVLNEMGAEGWEMISALPKSFPGDEAFGGLTTEIQYIFKRQVQN